MWIFLLRTVLGISTIVRTLEAHGKNRLAIYGAAYFEKLSDAFPKEKADLLFLSQSEDALVTYNQRGFFSVKELTYFVDLDLSQFKKFNSTELFSLWSFYWLTKHSDFDANAFSYPVSESFFAGRPLDKLTDRCIEHPNHHAKPAFWVPQATRTSYKKKELPVFNQSPL